MRTGSRVIDPAPPDLRDGGGGGGWAWLVTARGVMEAELIRGALEAAGIVDVYLDASDPTPGAWLYLSGNVNALVRVFVARAHLEDARLVLLEAGLDGEATTAEQPVRAPRGWRRWVWVVLAVVLVGLFLYATMHGAVTG